MNRTSYLLTILCLCLTTFAYGQQESLDILTFTAPEGYQREQVKGGVRFAKTAADGSGYCNLTVYTSRASSTEDVQKEFTSEWDELIKKSANIAAPEETQAAPPSGGWSIIFGIKPVKSDKGDYVISMMTIIGYKRVTSIVMVTKSDAFNGDLDTFLRSVGPLKDVAEGPTHPAR